MASKVLVTFAIGIFIQTISAQVIGNMYGPGIGPNFAAEAALAGALGQIGPGIPPYGPNVLPYEAAPILGCGFGLKLNELAANGGSFAVTSTSPITPTGISVQSEDLVFEGPLAVTGTMPFLGSVALEGPLPVVGQGAVSYGCGNGNVAMVAEEVPGPTVNNYPVTGPMAGSYWPYGPMY